MTTLNLQIKIKHSYLITNTVYKMLHQTSFLEIMHRYDIRRNVKKKRKRKRKTPIYVISRFQKIRFENLSPKLNTHDFGSVAYIITCRASTPVAC